MNHKKRIISMIVMIWAILATNTLLASNLPGTYTGYIENTAATLIFEESGNRITGKIDGEGYVYLLEGTSQVNTCSGKLTDPQTGGIMDFAASLEGSSLTFALIFINPNTGLQQKLDLNFTKQSGSTTPIKPQVNNKPKTISGQRDSRLIGTWRHSKTIVSGHFSTISEIFMRLDPDGSFVQGSGRLMIGGSTNNGSISGDTGTDDDVTRGYWKTENSVVYVSNDGRQWHFYSRYYAEPGKMMFKFEDGSNELWYKQ